MEVELDLWSSRSNDAVDHILSDVDCLGDVVGDVDVDEFMQLACSPADTTSPSCGDDERRARDSHAFTPDEPVLHHQQHALEHHHAHHAHHAHHHHHEHHHDLTSALHSARQQPFCGQPSGRGQLHNMGQLHHQLNLNHLSQPTAAAAAAAAAHLGLESMFDEAHQQQQQQQQQEAGEQASGAFQLEHSLAYHHALAGRLAASDQNDLHSHAHQFDSGAHQQQQQQLYAGTDLNGTQSAQHPGGYLAQDLLRQQQQQVSTTTTSTSATNGAAPSSSLVAARADHCYITAESASGQVDGLRQMGGAREEPAGCLGVSSSNGAAALPDREQLQRLLESRPQPISCALGESPLIAAINSKSQAPLASGGNKPAGARGRRAAAPASKRGAKQARNNQEASSSSSSTAAPQQPRNNNAKRAETMAAAAAAAAGGSKSLARAGARTRKTPPGGPLKKARVSGQVSPTLSAGSSSGVSSLSSPSGAASPSAQCAQPPEGPAGGPGGRPAGKRRARAQQQQQGGKATATTGQPAGALTRKLKGGAPDERRTAAAPAGVNSPAGAISSSSAARSASQLSFEANLSAKSREKLSSLSSCLISASGPPASSAGGLSGEQQQQASSSGGPAAANQRAAVSSSSSCSSPLASFAVSSASTGPQAPSARLLASSSPSANSSCSSSFGGSLRSPPSQRDQLNGSPVSSVSLSCSPTMQLGAGAGALGACSSSASGASAATTTASSAPTAASSFSLGSCSSSSNSSSSSSAASTASSSASCSLSSAAFSQQQPQRPHQSACLLSDQDWKSAQTGQAVRLTEEERRTLLAAGYPIPQRFPLSKAEERSLKKVRRKIKNKISAQESRRKKKEYMEELEKRVQLMEARIVELERDNERLARTVGEPAGASRLVTTGAGKQPRQRPSTKAARQPATMTGAPSQQPKSVDLLRSFAAAAAASAPADERQSVISPSQPQQQQLIKRKDSVQSNLNDDDHFIDDILMSQERQEAVESAAEAAAAAAGADIKVERHELLLE